MMETVFLTGGSGFVGGHVLAALLAEGYEVRALVRSQAAADALPKGAAPVLGDVRGAGHLVPSMRGCRYLVHTAALYSFAPRDRRLMHPVNVLGTAGLLEAARIAGIERAVVTSSSATADANKAATGSAYHASKLAQERAALASRVPVVLILPTAPVGPADRRPTPTGKMILDAARGRMFAYPPGRMNVVAVEDLAMAHLLALKRGRERERYVAGGANLALREVFSLAAKAGGKKPPARAVPMKLARLAARVDDLRCLAGLGWEPAVPLEGVRLAALDMSADSELARRDLGWVPQIGPEAAIERAVGWFRRQGYAA